MKSILLTVLVSLLRSQLTAGAAIGNALASIRNSSLLTDDSNTHCSTDFASYGRQFPGSVACIVAMSEIDNDHTFQHIPANYPFEFLSSRAPPPRENHQVKTPRRYSYATCTVAIALLSDVPPRFTPEIDPPFTPFANTAIVFFGAFNQASSALLKCMAPTSTNAGWVKMRNFASEGEVGIFAFKTGSPIDHAIPDGPRFPRSRLVAEMSDLDVKEE